MTDVENLENIINNRAASHGGVINAYGGSAYNLACDIANAGYRPATEIRTEFAEKVKSELEKYRLENEEFDGKNWTINATQLCAEFTNGIIDQLVREEE